MPFINSNTLAFSSVSQPIQYIELSIYNRRGLILKEIQRILKKIHKYFLKKLFSFVEFSEDNQKKKKQLISADELVHF